MNSSEAAEALEDGNLELALEKYSAAIALGTDSALLYSRRAQVLRWQSSFSNCSPASFSSCIAFCFSTRSTGASTCSAKCMFGESAICILSSAREKNPCYCSKVQSWRISGPVASLVAHAPSPTCKVQSPEIFALRAPFS